MGMPGLDHLVADAADDVLLAGGLEELVVLDGVGVGDEPLPVLVGRLGERVAEEVELELGGALDLEAVGGGPLELAAEDAPGGDLDRRALHGQQVAQDQHAARQPGQGPHRVGVDHRVEVAVAACPSWRIGSRAAAPCRRRRPAGSRTPRFRAPGTCSRKKAPVTRLPTGRPCRSGKATTTVSTSPDWIWWGRVCSVSIAQHSGPARARGRPALLGGHVGGGDPAVHHQRRSGDERGVVRGQEQRGLGDLLGPPEPPDGDVDQSSLPPGRVGQQLGQQRASRSGPGRSSWPGSPGGRTRRPARGSWPARRPWTRCRRSGRWPPRPGPRTRPR